MKRGAEVKENSIRTKSSPADVIQFSGCKDYQKSSEIVGPAWPVKVF